MNAAQLIEILSTFDPQARVVVASPEGTTFHELKEVGTDDPAEAVLWPESDALIEEDDDEIPPGTLPH